MYLLLTFRRNLLSISWFRSLWDSPVSTLILEMILDGSNVVKSRLCSVFIFRGCLNTVMFRTDFTCERTRKVDFTSGVRVQRRLTSFLLFSTSCETNPGESVLQVRIIKQLQATESQVEVPVWLIGCRQFYYREVNKYCVTLVAVVSCKYFNLKKKVCGRMFTTYIFIYLQSGFQNLICSVFQVWRCFWAQQGPLNGFKWHILNFYVVERFGDEINKSKRRWICQALYW